MEDKGTAKKAVKFIPELETWQRLHRYGGHGSFLDSRMLFPPEYLAEDILDARPFQYFSCF
jgi:hypothetical protein